MLCRGEVSLHCFLWVILLCRDETSPPLANFRDAKRLRVSGAPTTQEFAKFSQSSLPLWAGFHRGKISQPRGKRLHPPLREMENASGKRKKGFESQGKVWIRGNSQATLRGIFPLLKSRFNEFSFITVERRSLEVLALHATNIGKALVFFFLFFFWRCLWYKIMLNYFFSFSWRIKWLSFDVLELGKWVRYELGKWFWRFVFVRGNAMNMCFGVNFL